MPHMTVTADKNESTNKNMTREEVFASARSDIKSLSGASELPTVPGGIIVVLSNH